LASFGKEFRWTKFNAVERVSLESQEDGSRSVTLYQRFIGDGPQEGNFGRKKRKLEKGKLLTFKKKEKEKLFTYKKTRDALYCMIRAGAI